MSMPELRRADFRYTPYFCEENIWWLVHSLRDGGFEIEQARVWLITNPSHSVVLLNQNSVRPGKPTVWDYHVILQIDLDGSPSVLDFDTRLGFVSPKSAYLLASFPPQSALPGRFRAWVRTIPAASYLEHFSSDRSHMLAQLPPENFPDYPPIHPQDGVVSIRLGRYRNLLAELNDGSRVASLASLFPELA